MWFIGINFRKLSRNYLAGLYSKFLQRTWFFFSYLVLLDSVNLDKIKMNSAQSIHNVILQKKKNEKPYLFTSISILLQLNWRIGEEPEILKPWLWQWVCKGSSLACIMDIVNVFISRQLSAKFSLWAFKYLLTLLHWKVRVWASKDVCWTIGHWCIPSHS